MNSPWLTRSAVAASAIAGTTLAASFAFVVAAEPAANVRTERSAESDSAARNRACPGDMGGITLPVGFCATVFADNIGHARQMAVAEDGTLYVNTWSGAYYGNDDVPKGGFVVALKDNDGDGKADTTERFGETVESGGHGGTGIALYNNALYVESNDKILRYRLKDGKAVPEDSGDVVVSELPTTGDHPMHPFVIMPSGELLVDVASATNACETQNRQPHSRGNQPCVEKATRGGIWRYDAGKTGQVFSAKDRYASGIRNGEGLAVDAQGRAFATQHGRDQLHEGWPELYSAERGYESPAEELVRLIPGGEYGWPECYFDTVARRLVLAPEYGGDGGKKVGLCSKRLAPVATFPAHWAPNDLKFYRVTKGASIFPNAYRNGAFIAFHGSWNRAPGPQGGYNVVFQSFKDGKASGPYVVFADGFAGAVKEPGRAAFRPSGLAVAPDGALFISDDVHGRVWRVTYSGGNANAPIAAAPSSKNRAGNSRAEAPPEGIHPDAGKAANLPVPPGSSPDQVALGSRIFHGEISGATCGGCHGSDGRGSPVGADLTSGKWLWSDGSLAGIEETIKKGVPKPKEHGGAMPPLGGVQLSERDIRAVASYVWSIGHTKQ